MHTVSVLSPRKDNYNFDAYLIAAKCNSAEVFEVLLQEAPNISFCYSLSGDSTLYWILQNKLMDKSDLLETLNQQKSIDRILDDASSCADIYKNDHIKGLIDDLRSELCKQS